MALQGSRTQVGVSAAAEALFTSSPHLSIAPEAGSSPQERASVGSQAETFCLSPLFLADPFSPIQLY